ncbi:MAG: hypothetical protein RL238_1215 [Actinomycetota bacterium]|jgi:hypothetical protein
MPPEDVAREIAAEAVRFQAGDSDLIAFRAKFMGALHDLCRDEPLSGDHLEMFFALEAWEESVGEDRRSAAERVAGLAGRLAVGA